MLRLDSSAMSLISPKLVALFLWGAFGALWAGASVLVLRIVKRIISWDKYFIVANPLARQYGTQ